MSKDCLFSYHLQPNLQCNNSEWMHVYFVSKAPLHANLSNASNIIWLTDSKWMLSIELQHYCVNYRAQQLTLRINANLRQLFNQQMEAARWLYGSRIECNVTASVASFPTSPVRSLSLSYNFPGSMFFASILLHLLRLPFNLASPKTLSPFLLSSWT